MTSLFLVSIFLRFWQSFFVDDSIDTRRGEILLGFYVRAGLWIDGIEILTSFGRKSGVYGNAKGGSGYVEKKQVEIFYHANSRVTDIL